MLAAGDFLQDLAAVLAGDPLDAHALKGVDLAVGADEFAWWRSAKSRSQPSSWLEEVRSLIGQYGPGQQLVLVLPAAAA
jgi:hypothetical protein